MSFKLTDYEPYDFANRRHIGPSPSEMTDMLSLIGVGRGNEENVTEDLDKLIDDTVPDSIRLNEKLDWGPALSEKDTLFHMRQIADKNKVLTSST